MCSLHTFEYDSANILIVGLQSSLGSSSHRLHTGLGARWHQCRHPSPCWDWVIVLVCGSNSTRLLLHATNSSWNRWLRERFAWWSGPSEVTPNHLHDLELVIHQSKLQRASSLYTHIDLSSEANCVKVRRVVHFEMLCHSYRERLLG